MDYYFVELERRGLDARPMPLDLAYSIPYLIEVDGIMGSVSIFETDIVAEHHLN